MIGSADQSKQHEVEGISIFEFVSLFLFPARATLGYGSSKSTHSQHIQHTHDTFTTDDIRDTLKNTLMFNSITLTTQSFNTHSDTAVADSLRVSSGVIFQHASWMHSELPLAMTL